MKTNAYEIIKRPIITEKSAAETENKTYTFEVSKKANKTHIKAAIEELYGVEVAGVRTINTKRKPKTVGKYKGYRSGFKKAIVKLTKDSKAIDSFEL